MDTTKPADIEEQKDEVLATPESTEDAPKKLSKGQKKKLKEKEKKEAAKLAQEQQQTQGAPSSTESKPAISQDGKVPLRVLGEWPKDAHPKQTDYSKGIMPEVPVSKQFEKGSFPVGEIQEYEQDWNRFRFSSQEKKNMEKIFEPDYDLLRRAAEVHRQTRRYAQSFIKPGMKLMDICNNIEAANRQLIEKNGLEAGIAFPTGCSINHCAAHYTPNLGDETVLGYDDVMKIDYGSQLNGLMTDCAFTVAFNPTYDKLLEAVKDATNTGIKAAGVDMRLTDIGEQIQEVMESYECEIRGKTY